MNYIYIYIYIERERERQTDRQRQRESRESEREREGEVGRELVNFGKSDKMIKINGKVDKPTLSIDSAMIFRSLLKKKE